MPHFDGATIDDAQDHDRLKTLLDRVREYMADGQARSLAQIQAACGGSEASVSARLRDLRKDKFGGHQIDRDRLTGGLYVYRMVAKEATGQRVMF